MTKFIYITNYKEGEADLFRLEMTTLFNMLPKYQVLQSEVDFDVHRSIFIKKKITVLQKSKSFNDLLVQVKHDEYEFEQFRVNYIKHEKNEVPYSEQLYFMREIAEQVEGEPNIHYPKTLLGITKIEDDYIFGILELGKTGVELRQNKQHSYSISCSTRLARVLANLAMEHDLTREVIDPCCGVGTIVLELLEIGAKPQSNEINSKVAQMAMENILQFGHRHLVQVGDMNLIEKLYDVSIVDIPYGHFTSIEDGLQHDIIKSNAKFARRLVLLSHIPMDDLLVSVGYGILGHAYVDKGVEKFRRYVTVCTMSKPLL